MNVDSSDVNDPGTLPSTSLGVSPTWYAPEEEPLLGPDLQRRADGSFQTSDAPPWCGAENHACGPDQNSVLTLSTIVSVLERLERKVEELESTSKRCLSILKVLGHAKDEVNINDNVVFDLTSEGKYAHVTSLGKEYILHSDCSPHNENETRSPQITGRVLCIDRTSSTHFEVFVDDVINND